MNKIKNIIAVGSCKGGVGKSTVALNVALALQSLGYKVGLLDADIHGPSQPTMLGAAQKPATNENNLIEPIVAHGLKTMSIGYLIQPDQAVIWRGPMVTGAMLQFLNECDWGELDYLVFDLPPGTGDIQLTLAQKVPVTGALIVTTPQDVALKDVARSIMMFKKLEIPMLGVVENMSVYTCPNCAHESHIFGSGAADKIKAEYNLSILSNLPLNPDFCMLCDRGESNLFIDEITDSNLLEIRAKFMQLAQNLVDKIKNKPKGYVGNMPPIKVSTDD